MTLALGAREGASGVALLVHARLGRGRMVETCAATLEVGDERLDVVVKRPRPELSRNPAFTDALLTWGRSMADLDHEAVVAVLESGRSSEGVYVIQEHVDGVALAAVLSVLRKRRRTLTPAHAVTIADRIAGALEYLASGGRKGHGDLDPGEILVSYRGEVRLTDPRLSDLSAHVGADLVDEAGAGAYRAPEVVKGGPAGPEADVFALGLVLLEMLIGHPVWTAETMTVADAIAAVTDFTQIGQASPELTKALLQVLRGALAEDPAARPSAQKLQQELRQIRAAHGLEDDELGLGVFVEAILPPAEDEDAATQLMTPEQVEALRKTREAAADWDAASVLIDPEIEARAAAAFGKAPSASPPAPEVQAVEASPASPRPALVARTVPLDEASPASLLAARPTPPEPAGRPVSSPDASAGAAAWAQTLVEALRSPIGAGVAALTLLVVVVAFVFAGGAARTVKLRATSEPPKARLFVDGVELGATPFEQEVHTDEQVELRFELEGYQPHAVSIGTEAGEVRYEARLESAED